MYKTTDFPISHKENENRRGLILDYIKDIKHLKMLYIEACYGEVLEISGNKFKVLGCNIIVSKQEVLTKNIICDAKSDDAEY